MIKHKFFAFTLLIVMVFYIFKYQIPLVQYSLFKDYIVKNLCVNKDKKCNCCQGKCFLEKQIKLVNENSSTNENNNNKKTQNQEVKEFLRSHVLIIGPAEMISFLQVNTEAAKLQGFASTIFVPPKLDSFYYSDI